MKRQLAITLFVAVIFLLFAAQSRAQSVQLPPVPYMEFVDATGNPLSLGCVYSYGAGTTNPLATYADSTGSVPNANPLQLDASGGAQVWLTAGSAYKLAWYSNSTGAACPGTPGGALVLIKSVDNITTASSSGGTTATALTSASANPASAGVIRFAKGDQFCWRNAGNSGNLCLSLDANNNLVWGGESLALTEGTAPSGVTGQDLLYADPTAHRLKMTNNAGAAVQVVASGADINTSDQVTSTHLSAPLPPAQGGTGSTSASTGSGGVVLANSPTITSPTVNSATESTPTINGGISNSATGFQHVRFTSCSAMSASDCSGSQSWGSAFSDANYTLVCTANSGIFTAPFVVTVAPSKTSSGFSYDLYNPIASTTTVEIDCIGVHDH